MVTDQQVALLRQRQMEGKKQPTAAAMAGMSERSARKWQCGPLPSETKTERRWRTRPDPFDGVWEEEILPLLQGEAAGRLRATTIIEWLEEKSPGRFSASQLRTLQRRLQDWRALNGPDQEVYFPQEHPPGREAQLDFTHCNSLGVTIGGRRYRHLLFQLVLSHSGWRYAEVVAGETFVALKQGLQNALWELGGAPQVIRSDNSSALTHEIKRSRGRALNDNYAELLEHYGIEATLINSGESHENGVAEQAHYRLKDALDQALMLRGSRDFDSAESYTGFVRKVVERRNRLVQGKLEEERPLLQCLPPAPVPEYVNHQARVRKWSTIQAAGRTYTVPSRLIGKEVQIRLYAERLEVYYKGHLVERMERVRGEREANAIEVRIGELCHQFRLPTMGAQSVSRFTAAGHGDALETLLEVLEQEAEDRRQRRIGRLRTASRLPAGKTWETFEHDRVPLALRQQLGELSDGSFVERGVNVLAFGLPGTGKTHALCALGHRLVEAGRSVLFVPAYRLVQDLLAAKRDLALPRQLRKLDNYDFLLLDDLGYLPQGAEESEVLFTLIAERYERRSLGITSNLVFSQWEHIFANPMATAAAIDRVVHHSVILEFDVPSYRTGVAQQRSQKQGVNRQE